MWLLILLNWQAMSFLSSTPSIQSSSLFDCSSIFSPSYLSDDILTMSGATKVKYTIVTRHLNEAAYNSYAAGRPKTAALRTSYSRDRSKRFQYRFCICSCEYRALLIYRSGSDEVECRETDTPSDHDVTSQRAVTNSGRINKRVAGVIVDLLESNRHSKNFGACKVLTELRLRNIPDDMLPSKRQISNKIAYHRKRKMHFNNFISPLEESLRNFIFRDGGDVNDREEFKEPFVFCYDRDENGR